MFKANAARMMVELPLIAENDRSMTILIDPKFTMDGKTYGLLISFLVYSNGEVTAFDTFEEAQNFMVSF